MILQGKAKEAFTKWFDYYSQKHHQKEWLDNDLYLDEVYLPDELINSLIIQWLDSVGINAYTIPVYHFGGISFKSIIAGSELNMEEFYFFKNRQQATEKAIERAVELFNGK